MHAVYSAGRRLPVQSQQPGPASEPPVSATTPNPAALRALRRKQGGFGLVEVSIAVVVTLILAALVVPVINGLLIENKVPTVAGEVQRYIGRIKTMAEASGALPYANISTANNLVRAMEDSNVIRVTGNTVAHNLGGSGTGTNGVITVGPASLGGGANGSAFVVTFSNVSQYACPSLATTLQGMAEQIVINGETVKTLGTNNEQGTYNHLAAEEECVSGDNNTFAFTTR